MLIFDFDGTLADSNGIWVEVDDIFLARRGLKATPEYNEMIGHSIFPIAAQLHLFNFFPCPRRLKQMLQ